METKETKKTISKIRKLMQVTCENGATEGEVENAMRMARELAAKAALDDKDLILHPTDITELQFFDCRKSYENKNWIWNLLSAVGKGYNCEVLRSKKFNEKWKLIPVFKIIGFPEDVEFVKEIVNMIIPVIRNLADKKCRGYDTHAYRKIVYNSYVSGFTHGIYEKLSSTRIEKQYLNEAEYSAFQVIAVKKGDMVKDFINNKKLKSVNTAPAKINYSAYVAGQRDGQQYNQLNSMLN